MTCFGQAISGCLSKYDTFSGRAPRSEFWWFARLQVLLSLAGEMVGSGLLVGLLGLALLLPGLAVGARRLHDVGRSGWWQLLMLSGIGLLLLIFCWVQPTSEPADAREVASV